MKTFLPFRVLDLFIPRKGNQKTMNALSIGKTPLVSAKKINNGYKDFVEIEQKEIYKGHCITLNNDGDGGVGIAYYQPTSFALDTHVTALYPKIPMSKYQMLYIANCITKQRLLFSHGRSINNKRIKQLTVMLPVNKDGVPDYAFMEEYMKEIERKMLLRYRCYLEEYKLSISNTSCSNVEYRTFKIGSLFTVKRPNSRNKDNYDEGDVCFVASGAENNGVVKYCSPKIGEQLDAGNCLTVSPVDGSCFYQPADFLGRGGGGSSILLLYSKNFVLNKYIGLYISEAIKKTTTSKYCYGHMATNESIIRDTIQLPVTSSGEVDYTYMEKYMKAKEAEMLKRYIDYKLAKI